MPCQFCEEHYRHKPCLKIIDSDAILKSFPISPHVRRSLVTRHLILSCPCKNCLIKLICKTTCEEYYSVVK